MSVDYDELKSRFPVAENSLLEEILEFGIFKEIPANLEILREGQYVQAVPLLLDGLIKVFQGHEDKELLLYYIQPSESCIMSFTSAFQGAPSRIFAVTEEDTRLILLPDVKVKEWVEKYPSFNSLFYSQFDKRYDELLETIQQVIFKNLDERLADYLKEKKKVTHSPFINLRHKQIANELGTSREVISRLLKKMEKAGKIRQSTEGIEILEDL